MGLAAFWRNLNPRSTSAGQRFFGNRSGVGNAWHPPQVRSTDARLAAAAVVTCAGAGSGAGFDGAGRVRWTTHATIATTASDNDTTVVASTARDALGKRRMNHVTELIHRKRGEVQFAVVLQIIGLLPFFFPYSPAS
jgi:hypothetical protein